MSETNETEQDKEEKKRKVSISKDVMVIFPDSTVVCSRDVFSVMNAITERIAKCTTKEEADALTVSVHSFEDESKSEAPAEGEARWEGPYLVAGLEIENMKPTDAMQELTKGIIPGDAAIRQYEYLTEQIFQRTLVGAVTVVVGFDTGMATIPLVNSMRDVNPRVMEGMYQSLVQSAENLKEFCKKTFPEKEFDFDRKPEENRSKKEDIVLPNSPPKRDLQLPSGFPASMASKGIVTAEQHRKTQIPVVHLT